MKLASVMLLSLAALTYAADQSNQPLKSATNPSAGTNTQVVKKMGSVTWDVNTHKLLWTVQTGTLVNGEFVPASEERYEISPEEATMGTADEKRGLDGDEADGLHQLLDILSLYCAESVMWWDKGLGTPVQSDPAKPDVSAPQKPVKIQEQPSAPAPKQAQPGQWVAELHGNQ
jgi:hypothetical protein